MFRLLKILTLILIVFSIAYLTIPPFLYDVDSLREKIPETTAMMNYRLKAAKKRGENLHLYKMYVPMKQISPYLIRAVLIAEDDKFYKHEGFDLEGIKLAISKNLKKRKLKYGGSTITQQLAKNIFLGSRKSIIRKIHEAILTIRIEKRLSKRRILELYLNIAEWGYGVFGAEAASRYYFKKPCLELNPNEAALLAAILPNPLKYSPLTPSNYIRKRAEKILYIMKIRNIISEEYDVSEKEAETDSVTYEMTPVSSTPQDENINGIDQGVDSIPADSQNSLK
ncbi:MAG: monofunctional biosynthetic peptidoglycan transglycosylase [candidate division WOR-3 bacterium]